MDEEIALVECRICKKTVDAGEALALSSGYVCADCKDLEVQRMREGVEDASDAETVRREHLTHEVSLKSVGILIYIGAVASIFIAILIFSGQAPEDQAVGVGALLLGIFSIWVGTLYRRLSPRVKIPGTILSALGLLNFPFGTLINGYILYLIHSEKGRRILTPEYHEIIAQTPHVEYRTPLFIKIILIFLVLFFVVAIVGAVLSSP